MSAATVFRPGGHFYDLVDRAIDLLPKGLPTSAHFRLVGKRREL